MNCRTWPVVVILLLAGCSYVPFSGGELEGKLVAAPTDWTETASTEIIELETNPADPYSVKLWIVGLGSSLYVHAGANRAAWVEHVDVDSHVRLLIDDKLFELRAVRVETQDEFDTFSDAYESKYGNRPRNENVAEAYLFRLETRT